MLDMLLFDLYFISYAPLQAKRMIRSLNLQHNRTKLGKINLIKNFDQKYVHCDIFHFMCLMLLK